MLLEIFQHDFIARALIVGSATAITAAMLGNFVVASRQAVVSEMLAHTALVGVGLGIYLHISPSFLGLIFTFVFAGALWLLLRDKKQAPEAISVFLLTGGLAMALLLVHLNKNNPVTLDNYLFGSILTITTTEMYIFLGINALIVLVLLLLWRPFLMLVFDADFLRIQSKKYTLYEILFLFLVAGIVGVGLKIVGGLLVGALLVAPVLISNSFCKSFSSSIVSSIFCNVFAVFAGIVGSYYLDIPSSSSIILVLIIVYLLTKSTSLISRNV